MTSKYKNKKAGDLLQWLGISTISKSLVRKMVIKEVIFLIKKEY